MTLPGNLPQSLQPGLKPCLAPLLPGYKTFCWWSAHHCRLYLSDQPYKQSLSELGSELAAQETFSATVLTPPSAPLPSCLLPVSLSLKV